MTTDLDPILPDAQPVAPDQPETAAPHTEGVPILAGQQPGSAIPSPSPGHVPDVELYFNPSFYLRQNPDVRGSLLTPLQHYLDFGCREGRAPNRWFDERYYLSQLGTASVEGVPPFLHWVNEGRPAGVPPGEGIHVTREGAVVLARGHEGCAECALMKEEFDPLYYAQKYRHVPSAGCETDLLMHYCEQGWKEGLNPAPWFDLAAYLAFSPDVLAANINPFTHFLRQGRTEARATQWKSPGESSLIERAVPASARLKVAPPRRNERLNVPLASHMPDATARKGVVLAFGNDVYVRHLGGIQLFTSEEQQLLNGRDLTYLHLAPAVPSLAIRVGAGANLPGMVSVTMDGRYLGVAELDDVLPQVPLLAGKGAPVWAVIHALLGFNVDALRERLSHGFEKVFFWLHDYHSACAGFNLLRNDATYCGLPAPGAIPCDVCVYGPERRTFEPVLHRFFEEVRPFVCSPSETALAVWKRAGRPHAGARVVPHWTLEPVTCETVRNGPPGPVFRLAFLGHAAPHKGWLTFLRLVENFSHRPEYEFWHLGERPGDDSRVRFQRVAGSATDRDAMQRALVECRADAAFLYSIWPETFSYTLYESLCAGVRVFTHANSGNIRAQVESLGVGLVFETEDEILTLFGNARRLHQRVAGCRRPSFKRTGVGTTAAILQF